GGAQDQGRVLYGVVVVDVGVAAGLDLEVEQGVRRQGGEEVVEEPHPGVDGSLAGAVEVEGDLHGGLGGATVELGGAVHRSSRRICAARRWAVRPSAVASSVMVGAMASRPSRVRRWTWRHDPKSVVDSGPQATARPPVGRTWLAPVA